eukprot:2026282-Prorocentrum_lima.AAC.1
MSVGFDLELWITIKGHNVANELFRDPAPPKSVFQADVGNAVEGLFPVQEKDVYRKLRAFRNVCDPSGT